MAVVAAEEVVAAVAAVVVTVAVLLAVAEAEGPRAVPAESSSATSSPRSLPVKFWASSHLLHRLRRLGSPSATSKCSARRRPRRLPCRPPSEARIC